MMKFFGMGNKSKSSNSSSGGGLESQKIDYRVRLRAEEFIQLARYYPVVPNISSLDTLVSDVLSKYKNQEFCISPTFEPQFIDAVCQHGFLPMSLSICKLI